MNNMKEIEVSGLFCPHCKHELERYYNTFLTKKEAVDYEIEAGSIFYDGDTIPFNESELSFKVNEDAYYAQLLKGSCPKCKEDYFALEIALTSQPIKDFCIFCPDYMGGDFYYVEKRGIEKLYQEQHNESHLVFKVTGRQMKDRKESFDMEHHIVGPFSMLDSIEGENGVSYHNGKSTWEYAKTITKDILKSRKEFITASSR